MLNSPSFVGNGHDPTWFVGGYPNSSIDSADGQATISDQANSAVNSTNRPGTCLPPRSTKILESDSKFQDSIPDGLHLMESPSSRRHIFPTSKAKFVINSQNINTHATARNGHPGIAANTSVYHPNTMMMPTPISQDFPAYNAADSIATLARPKSQNIAITRSRGCEDSIHHDSSNENLYDWATWRMYHRITSARRSRIASVAPIISYRDDASTPVTLHNETVTPSRRDDGQSVPCLSSIDYSHQGEVFEIEL